MMDNNRKLAHVVAYYISRFDKDALKNLGYGSFSEAFIQSAEALGVKRNYLKFNRDEFDVVHPHKKGWRNRPIAPSISDTINALQSLDKIALTNIVQDIIKNGKKLELIEDLEQLISIIPDKRKKTKKREYTLRNVTGKKAEELFVDWFKSDQKILPQGKNLVDMRDYGCGYDFQIVVSEKQVYAIEVKGLLEDEGGILITSKEWETASRMKTDYYLVLVSNIDSDAVITIINNPYEKLSPKRNLQTVIQVNWTVSPKEIRHIIEKS